MANEIIRILSNWNPWWETGKVPDNLIGFPREKTQEMFNLLKLREIKILTGIRRGGKSTLFYQIINNLLEKGVDPKNILLINFEDAALSHYSLEVIYNSYSSELNPSDNLIFIDEVQRKEGWEKWIRKSYDLKYASNFFISSSSSSLLKKEYSTLLTGRNITTELFPLSFREFLKFSEIDVKDVRLLTDKTKAKIIFNLKKYIEFGGFPEIFFKEKDYKRKLLNQYFEDIIYKDIVDRYNTNSTKTKEVGVYLLTNIANLLSLRKLRDVFGLGLQTISNYISYMSEAYLIYKVPIFSHSLKIQSVNPKKVYCIDTGLRNAVSFKFSEDIGRLVENIIFIELKRRKKEVYYWKGKNETDFVIKEGLKPKELIQVCWNVEDEKTKKREVKGLLEALKEFKLKKGLVITEDYLGEERIGAQKIEYKPLWMWLLQ